MNDCMGIVELNKGDLPECFLVDFWAKFEANYQQILNLWNQIPRQVILENN